LGLNRREFRSGEEWRRSISVCGVGRNGLSVGRADHLASLLVQKDAYRSAVGQAERIDELFAARAVDDADQRSSATTAMSRLPRRSGHECSRH
jgi:hypothetical protein